MLLNLEKRNLNFFCTLKRLTNLWLNNLNKMQQHTNFFSLKRYSGILLGLYGLAAVYLINILSSGEQSGIELVSQLPLLFLQIGVTVLALVFIVISLFTLWIRAKRTARRNDQKLWNTLTRKIRWQTLISLLVLLIIIIMISNIGYFSLTTPLSLLFYGLFVLSLNKFSSIGLRYLALAEIILAIASYVIYDKEIMFLAIGFGLLPILYGITTFIKTKN